uniref:60S ribosomal protein L10P insertion domain-containing protein n=1 Tax=Vitis vinifera TaxID=29760 RepID=F6H889_VITVI
MMKHSTRLRAEKTGNPVFLNLVPLLVGNVGLISTKGDLKEVDKEVAKYKVGAPARAGLVAHIDVIVPPGNTGLDLAHTRASIKPISPTFSQPLHQGHSPSPPAVYAVNSPPTHLHAHLSHILEFPCKQSPMHVVTFPLSITTFSPL